MIESYSIFQIPRESGSVRIEDLNPEEAVEVGLSPGEVRQSLLDRLRQLIKKENFTLLNNNLLQFDLYVHERNVGKAVSLKQVEKDVEEMVYTLTDDELSNTYWTFKKEKIFVLGNEE